MRSSISKIVASVILLAIASYASGFSTSKEEEICKEIGFKKKNEEFGKCVLTLLEKKDALDKKPKKTVEDQFKLASIKSSPAIPDSTNIWDLNQIAQSNSFFTYLNRPDGSTYSTVQLADIKLLVSMTNAIGLSAGIKPVLYIRESDEFNAAATYDKNGLPIIIINKPMFDLIKDDSDMAAALIGHEVAHLSLNHSNSRFVKNTLGTVLGVVAGVALESIIRNNYGVANVGIQGGNIVGIAFSSSFTREQEREADRMGILWAKENGYDPSGAVRLFKVLENKSSNKTLPFLRSHPNPTERIKNAEQAVK